MMDTVMPFAWVSLAQGEVNDHLQCPSTDVHFEVVRLANVKLKNIKHFEGNFRRLLPPASVLFICAVTTKYHEVGHPERTESSCHRSRGQKVQDPAAGVRCLGKDRASLPRWHLTAAFHREDDAVSQHSQG